MTVVSVQGGADPRVRKVGLSDGSSFFIGTSYLEPAAAGLSFVGSGRDLSEAEEASLLHARECLAAERAALRLIALREHCRAALAVKLAQRGYGARISAAVLDRLEAENLVDDSRFSELWVLSRIARRCEGPRLLIAGLRKRGVSRETAAAAVERTVNSEDECALIRKFLEASDVPRDDPQTVFRLRAAGFGSAAIRSVLEDAE